MITTIRIAYKIGFSCALNYRVISAYKEAAKYNFGDDQHLSRRLVRAFCRGFSHGRKLSVAVHADNSIVNTNRAYSYEFLEPTCATI